MIFQGSGMRWRLAPVGGPGRQARQYKVRAVCMTGLFERLQVDEASVETRTTGQQEIALGEFLKGDCTFDLHRELVLCTPLPLGQLQSDPR